MINLRGENVYSSLSTSDRESHGGDSYMGRAVVQMRRVIEDMRQIALQECLACSLVRPFSPTEYRWWLEHTRNCAITFVPVRSLPGKGKVGGLCIDTTPADTPPGGKVSYEIQYVIGLTANDLVHTLFHELGHIVLGHQIIVDVAWLHDKRPWQLKDMEDLEAESFADAMTLFSLWGVPIDLIDGGVLSTTSINTDTWLTRFRTNGIGSARHREHLTGFIKARS